MNSKHHGIPTLHIRQGDIKTTTEVLTSLVAQIQEVVTCLQQILPTDATEQNPTLGLFPFRATALAMGLLSTAGRVTAAIQPDPELDDLYRGAYAVLKDIVETAMPVPAPEKGATDATAN
jgi:hypothetical protein